MPIDSREKGARGELELAKYIRERGVEARRGRQFKGGSDSPDIVADLPGIHIECKRVERGSLYEWLAQAVRDAGGKLMPVVMHRKNHKGWVVIMRLDDFLELHSRAQ